MVDSEPSDNSIGLNRRNYGQSFPPRRCNRPTRGGAADSSNQIQRHRSSPCPRRPRQGLSAPRHALGTSIRAAPNRLPVSLSTGGAQRDIATESAVGARPHPRGSAWRVGASDQLGGFVPGTQEPVVANPGEPRRENVEDCQPWPDGVFEPCRRRISFHGCF